MTRGHSDWQPFTSVQRFAGTGGAVPFEQKITVSANTTSGSPTSQTIELIKGFLSKAIIRFPSGPAGLMGIQIFDAATLLYPSVAAQWLTGDNEVVEWDTEYDIPDVGGTRLLTIKGYNSDDSYAHSALVRMWVVALP